MGLLQLREKEIFETLKKIKDYKFVLIGGYAVNVYTLPRFSVDCDIVVEDEQELKKIQKAVEEFGYVKKDISKLNFAYKHEFIPYEKGIGNNFKVMMDILFNNIWERRTKAMFSAKWVFENASVMSLKGKTITEELKLRIINPDALIAMKFVSCRPNDIRDVFMLIVHAENLDWIRDEIRKRCNFKEKFERVKDKITSKEFKDDLQGVYGYIDERLFDKHKKNVLKLAEKN